MERLSRLFPRSPGPWLAALLLGAVVTGLRLWSLGGTLPLFWGDALEAAGGILILLGQLNLGKDGRDPDLQVSFADLKELPVVFFSDG